MVIGSQGNLWTGHIAGPHHADYTAYPVIKEVALFYASFIEQCQRDEAGKAIIRPSYNPEHGPFGGTLRVLNPWTGQIDELATQPMGKVVFTP